MPPQDPHEPTSEPADEFEIEIPEAPAGTETPPPSSAPPSYAPPSGIYGPGAYPADPYASGYGSGAYDSALASRTGRRPYASPPQAMPPLPARPALQPHPPRPPPQQASGVGFSIAPPPAVPAPGQPGAAAAPPPPAAETLPTGAVLDGKYQILVKLGQGGMGAVYRARHLLLNKDVALKVIAPHLAQDPSFKARFFREAKVAMEFVHRHAIPVRDFGVTGDGLYYMTMDFSTGTSLRVLVEREGALPAERAVRIVRMILDALAEAHRKRIIHRDLKPDNVMVEQQDGKDFVKVLDFGLAKMVTGEDEAASLATAGQILGTPAYMSPEQGCGEEVDHRADLYACGVILYQLLTGRLPFTGPTSRQLIMKHVSAPPPSFQQAAPGLVLPPGLEDVVMKALAKEKHDRFQSAEEFSQALAPFVSPASGERRPLVQIGGGAHAGQETVTGETFIPEEVSGSLTGHTIDRYKILAPIAEGGMGAVYHAEHLLMHRECAFKVIKGGHQNDEEVLSRFQREAQVSARFKHPSAVEVYDFGRMGKKMFFMAMELVRGKPLTKRIEAEGALPLRDTVEIAVQLLDVLDAAHKAGIVHRDLKPDNIMLQEVDGWKNQVKLLDFGIAKLKDAKGEASKFHTMTGVFFGTPQYSSPEQCKGEPVDGRSDIYSVGVILYEMLTGHLPFESETPQGFLVQHLVTPPKKISEVNPAAKVPPEVEAVVMRALEKSADKRFATAHEFADALKRAAQIFPAFEVGEHGLKPASGGGFFGFGQFRELRTSKKFVVSVSAIGALVATLLVFLTGRGGDETGRLILRTKPGGVSVAVFAEEGGSALQGQSAESGELEFPQLAPGNYRVIFAKSGFRRIEQEIRIEGGQTLELAPTLAPDS